jgi:hypothetical protein
MAASATRRAGRSAASRRCRSSEPDMTKLPIPDAVPDRPGTCPAIVDQGDAVGFFGDGFGELDGRFAAANEGGASGLQQATPRHRGAPRGSLRPARRGRDRRRPVTARAGAAR